MVQRFASSTQARAHLDTGFDTGADPHTSHTEGFGSFGDFLAKAVPNRSERIRLLAAARAQAVVIKAEAQRQARIIRKRADAEALRLGKAALADNSHMLTYRYKPTISRQSSTTVLRVAQNRL